MHGWLICTIHYTNRSINHNAWFDHGSPGFLQITLKLSPSARDVMALLRCSSSGHLTLYTISPSTNQTPKMTKKLIAWRPIPLIIMSEQRFKAIFPISRASMTACSKRIAIRAKLPTSIVRGNRGLVSRKNLDKLRVTISSLQLDIGIDEPCKIAHTRLISWSLLLAQGTIKIEKI